MKEFKYNDQPGFENMNTPTAEDIFELSYVRGMKDREIFDLSFAKIIDDPGTGATESGYESGYFITEDVNTFHYSRIFLNTDAYWNSNNWTSSAGLAAENMQFIPEGYDGNPDNEDNETGHEGPVDNVFNLLRISEDKYGYDSYGRELYVPAFNEDLAAYVGPGVSNAFGGGDMGSAIQFFRSGYLELTLKAEKQNCIIAYGSRFAADSGGTFADDADEAGLYPTVSRPISIDSSTSITNEAYSDISKVQVGLKNGKLYLTYEKYFGNTAQVYELYGNKNIADNAWHHIVINFNKEGMIRENGQKTNSKPIEFWIDGKLDKQDDSLRTDKQIFFPLFAWLGVDPVETFGPTREFEHPYITGLSGWRTFDRDAGFEQDDDFIGFRGPKKSNVVAGYFNPESKQNNFKGAIHTWVSGINIPLSKSEIEFRNLLYFQKLNTLTETFTATATMIDPTVSANKPRALKLFWNNLILDRAKDGIELDNNFAIESYSVTHRVANSATEVYNVDFANEKELQFLSDVRFVIKDNLIPFGPGKLIDDNYPDYFFLSGRGKQWDMTTYGAWNNFTIDGTGNHDYRQRFLTAAVKNYSYSGSSINDGDRILLVNQFDPKDNGVWIYNGPDSFITRATDADSPHKLINSVVRITDGIYKDTSWIMTSNISNFQETQIWHELEYHPDSNTIGAQPIFGKRWENENGTPRLINLQDDIDLSKYDLICFMNYPENEDEVNEHMINFTTGEQRNAYDNFIKSLVNAAATGSSIFVSSPKLAQDMGIIKNATTVTQALEESDAQAAAVNPFQPNEPAERYFDTHRNNKYQMVTTLSGLTNKPTYIMTDFVNYVPEDDYSYEEWHVKYAYRATGPGECCEFFIPGLSTRSISNSDNLPGYRQNSKTTKDLRVVKVSDILAGTQISRLANTYYDGDTAINNPYHLYVTTLIVHDNQILGTQPISGKIFVNFVEDGYTFSKLEYNKAYIQNFDANSVDENVSTVLWQYSTSRLNRQPKRVNVAGITKEGQTVPTIHGGGPLLQSQTASSNGIVRRQTDDQEEANKSNLYRNSDQEIYDLTEINVYSMTWLGLQWLIGQ